MKNLNVKELNNLILFGKKIAKIVYLLIIVLGLYALTILVKELKILDFVFTVLSILFPFFLALVISWLFEPIVQKLMNKGLKRVYSVVLIYFVLLASLGIIIGLLIPALSTQVDDFAQAIPDIAENVEGWVDAGFDKVGTIEGIDQEAVKSELFSNFDEWANELPKTLPTYTLNIVKAFFEGLGNLVIGLVIGFYLLVSSHSKKKFYEGIIPKKFKDDVSTLTKELNQSLRGFVQGTLLLSLLIFVVSYIGFSIVGLKGALIFALICGITNIIPIIGPYIGGIPAIIVALSQSFTIGLLVFIIIAVVQFLEGNFFHPILLSKTMKLNPVSIILGLLIFGHFWGIFGMIVATPVLSIAKKLFTFFDNKFGIFKNND